MGTSVQDSEATLLEASSHGGSVRLRGVRRPGFARAATSTVSRGRRRVRARWPRPSIPRPGPCTSPIRSPTRSAWTARDRPGIRVAPSGRGRSRREPTPSAVALDTTDKKVFVADESANQLTVFSTSSCNATTTSGCGTTTTISDSGNQLEGPRALAVYGTTSTAPRSTWPITPGRCPCTTRRRTVRHQRLPAAGDDSLGYRGRPVERSRLPHGQSPTRGSSTSDATTCNVTTTSGCGATPGNGRGRGQPGQPRRGRHGREPVRRQRRAGRRRHGGQPVRSVRRDDDPDRQSIRRRARPVGRVVAERTSGPGRAERHSLPGDDPGHHRSAVGIDHGQRLSRIRLRHGGLARGRPRSGTTHGSSTARPASASTSSRT